MYVHVVMPIGSDPDAATKISTIRAVASEVELEVHLPTYDVASPAFDLATSLEDIRSAGFILADLTGERPSCYYELGLAEATGKVVQVIAKAGTDIHQTAARSHAIYYDAGPSYERAVREAFARGLRSAQNT